MMFPTNPFPQVFPPSISFLDHQKDDLYTNPFLSGDWFPADEKLTTSNQDLVEGQGLEQCDEYNHLFWPEVNNKKPSKKDHHCKIHTAQGPRDRRVRLSIEVAKKFFYLQDLLEYDKASRTLDWLFNKSKIAIDELIKRKKQSSSSTVTDRSEVVFLETGSDEKGPKKKCGEGKRKKVARKYKSGFSVNQSRAEARARARERTKEKLNVKKIDDKISMLYSYQHNLDVSNDSSSKFTSFPRFTDAQRFRSIGGTGEPTADSNKDLVIHINKLSN